jgi:hypothetical protein
LLQSLGDFHRWIESRSDKPEALIQWRTPKQPGSKIVTPDSLDDFPWVPPDLIVSRRARCASSGIYFKRKGVDAVLSGAKTPLES